MLRDRTSENKKKKKERKQKGKTNKELNKQKAA